MRRSYHLDRDLDGFGDPEGLLDACERPEGYVENAEDCDDGCSGCYPGALQLCTEDRDHDCDGVSARPVCTCVEGDVQACGPARAGACVPGTRACNAAGTWGECRDASGPTAETCNGLDDDCDGAVDAPLPTDACDAATGGALSVACVEGRCAVTACAAGRGDCDAAVANGCESTLDTTAHCGACGANCGLGELCRGRTCEPVPFPGWVIAAGSGSWDDARAVAFEPAGDVLVATQFAGNVAGDLNITSSDVEVAIFRIRTDGTILWTSRITSAVAVQADAIAVAGGRVCVGGAYSSDARAGAFAIAGGTSDAWLACLDAATGVPNWLVGVPGGGLEQVLALTASGDQLYASGRFGGTVTFTGHAPRVSAGGTDAFVARIDAATGNVSWTLTFGGTGDDELEAVAFESGRLIAGGAFRGTISIGSLPPVTSTGSRDALLVGVTAGGAALWATTFTGADPAVVRALAARGDGDVVAAGDHYGDTRVGGVTLVSAGQWDAFVARVDSSTGNVRWATNMGGPGWDVHNAVAVDPTTGVIVVGGSFAETITTGVPVPITSRGETDAVTFALDATSGGVLWADSFGGLQSDAVHALAVDAHGHIARSGWYEGGVTFRSGARLALVSSGWDFFVESVSLR